MPGKRRIIDTVPMVVIPTSIQRWSTDVVPTSVCRPFVRRRHTVITDVVPTVDIDVGTTSVCRRWHDVGMPTVGYADVVPTVAFRRRANEPAWSETKFEFSKFYAKLHDALRFYTYGNCSRTYKHKSVTTYLPCLWLFAC